MEENRQNHAAMAHTSFAVAPIPDAYCGKPMHRMRFSNIGSERRESHFGSVLSEVMIQHVLQPDQPTSARSLLWQPYTPNQICKPWVRAQRVPHWIG